MFSGVDVPIKMCGRSELFQKCGVLESQITLITEANTFLTGVFILSRPEEFDQRNSSDVVTEASLGSHYQKISISQFQRLARREKICKLTSRPENRGCKKETDL